MKSAEITFADLCEVIRALDEARYHEPDLDKVKAAKLKLQKLIVELIEDES